MFDVLREQMLAGSKLDQAIKDNNVSLVQELIEQNPDQNIVDGEISGVPKIMYAAQNGFWDIVKVLFNENAEIDCKIEYRNRYFVHECIENAPEKILKAVLDYANLNNKNHKK
jgi:transcriptional regulator